ncbi:SRPBCC domain-containing protein [Pseudalkalibacillus salsuginis]|uniref:SRPBCC domain-containing protein n=1 Tax=Pseudalkalibacillus salsuginis TaxID=2910972 RepID=UPI002AFE1665|nr:SRPBCC domain-containing protein [Pseudalkalibacillus salsuginis]
MFAAWSNRETKKNWFQKANEFDFRVGGRESMKIGPPGGPIFTFAARYQEIVPDQRIVYSYTMDLDEIRILASMTTVEFKHSSGFRYDPPLDLICSPWPVAPYRSGIF